MVGCDHAGIQGLLKLKQEDLRVLASFMWNGSHILSTTPGTKNNHKAHFTDKKTKA